MEKMRWVLTNRQGGKGRISATDVGQRETPYIHLFLFFSFVERKSRTERLRSRFGDYAAVAVILLRGYGKRGPTFRPLCIADRK